MNHNIGEKRNDAMLYWISLVENMNGDDNGGSGGEGDGGGGSGRDHNGATSPSLLETEIVRLRVPYCCMKQERKLKNGRIW